MLGTRLPSLPLSALLTGSGCSLPCLGNLGKPHPKDLNSRSTSHLFSVLAVTVPSRLGQQC